MRWLLPACVLLLLAGCGYRPPPQVDTAARSYQDDLFACDSNAGGAVTRRDAKTFPSWLVSFTTRWTEVPEAVSGCMAGKGWGRTRSCTADELHGQTSTRQVVTSSGIRCIDPTTRG